jgi:hypothetical protein
MIGIRRGLSWLGAALCLLAGAIACAQPATSDLPKLKDMPTPTTEVLLTGKATDWIVTNTDDVLVVDSLVPRPDTLAKIQEKITAKEEERRKASSEDRPKITEEIEALGFLYLTLPDGREVSEFRLPLKLVKTIIHHEDLMLRRLDALLAERNIEQALELLMRLQRDRPDWPGVKEAGLNVLFTDAGARLDAGQLEPTLVLLDELYERSPQYPGLSERMGDVIRRLADESLAQGKYLRMLYFLNRLQQKYPGHPTFRQFETRLTELARQKMRDAAQSGERKDWRGAGASAELAVRIWPKAADLKAPHKVALDRYPRLHVGVDGLPGEGRAYPVPTPADDRAARLTQLTLFEIDRFRDGAAYYRTRFFDEWEPRDLGRQMHFTMRQFRQPYEIQSAVSAADAVAPLLRCLDRALPEFDERLESFIESVQVISPTEFLLTFRRVPPRLEPLLSKLSLIAPESAGDVSALMDPGGFRIADRSAEAIHYVRKLVEPDGLPKYHVAEIIEHRYSTPEKIVQALHQGEIVMAPALPDSAIRRLQGDDEFLKRFFVQPYAVPRTHLLQFNPASQPLRLRELRAALAYAVDREQILKEIVLEDSAAAHGRLVTTPFFESSPGRNVLVGPRRHDLSAALALALSAKHKLMGAVPPLTMIVAPGPVPRAAAEEMAKVWRKIGLTINVVQAEDPAPANWDILYRTLQMTEPVIEMWPFLTFEERARITSLDIYPDWLKQELVQLDRTTDQSRAVEALQTLHRHLTDDTAFAPLWEVDEFLVLRKTVQGFRPKPIHCYDDIDRWTIDPWYTTEFP